MIDTTVGIESVTWYQRDQNDRRRVQITFQDELRKDFIGGEKLPGEIELYGDSTDAPLGRMSIDSPQALDQLAKAIEIAAQHWRHCIQECQCFQEDESGQPNSEDVKVISFGDFNLADLFPEEEDEEEPDDHK